LLFISIKILVVLSLGDNLNIQYKYNTFLRVRTHIFKINTPFT